MRSIVQLNKFRFSTSRLASLPDLSYDYSELQPVISAKLLEFHHKKHHQAYVNNYNLTLEKLDAAKTPADITQLTKLLSFNGGGHVNHSIFWTNLSPVSKNGGQLPNSSSALTKAVTRDFGSFDNLIQQLSTKAVGVQGSGWGWLGYDPITKSLRVVETSNQDLLVNVHGLVPLLTIDVWEHAYYLDYQNLRPSFVKEIWKVVNWKNVEERYLAATM